MANPDYRLSKRQIQILRKIASGKTDKEIATEIGIKENTVAFHLRIVFARLRVRSRVQAVLRWKRIGPLHERVATNV